MVKKEQYPLSKVDSNDTKTELNCRPIKPVLRYLEEKYGHEKLENFIYETKMNLAYLENENNWVSYDYFCRLLAKLVEYTGNPRAPFIAGLYTTKKECYGDLQTFFSRLGTPGSTYKFIAEYTPRYSKLNKWEISDLKRDSCIIILKMLSEYKQNKNNCLNVQGILASIPTLWKLTLAKVEEVECAAEGADSCVYRVSWRNKPSRLFGICGLLTGVVLGYFIKVFLWTTANVFIVAMIPMWGYLIGRIKDYKVAVKESIEINEKESEGLMESIETIERLNIELQDKVEQRTKELQKALVDLKNSQERLIQSEKLASIGRLAAGMAHELNNPVGAVRNYIQDVLEDISPKDPLWERLKNVEKATGRCKKIVNALLTFARENKEMRLCNINDIIEVTTREAREEILNPSIKIYKNLETNLSKVKLDPMQIQQVVMNIIMNASDAVKDEGQIVVKTSETFENISVEISDSGRGIPEDIQDKIFDPFFTTKAPGNGIGLGLAISYNIVKRFNGSIQVKSREGEGAAFTITIPKSDT